MSNGKTKELLSYMNSFNSSDEIDEKLNCLKSIISYSQYTVSDYKTVIYFLIEKTLTIHSLFEKESAETNEIKKYLNNFTKFNDDYKCVNELYQGFYSFKLIELNSDSNSTTNIENIILTATRNYLIPQIKFTAVGNEYNITNGNLAIVDLTEIYGAGNEPATPQEFLQDYPEFNNFVPYKPI